MASPVNNADNKVSDNNASERPFPLGAQTDLVGSSNGRRVVQVSTDRKESVKLRKKDGAYTNTLYRAPGKPPQIEILRSVNEDAVASPVTPHRDLASSLASDRVKHTQKDSTNNSETTSLPKTTASLSQRLSTMSMDDSANPEPSTPGSRGRSSSSSSSSSSQSGSFLTQRLLSESGSSSSMDNLAGIHSSSSAPATPVETPITRPLTSSGIDVSHINLDETPTTRTSNASTAPSSSSSSRRESFSSDSRPLLPGSRSSSHDELAGFRTHFHPASSSPATPSSDNAMPTPQTASGAGVSATVLNNVKQVAKNLLHEFNSASVLEVFYPQPVSLRSTSGYDADYDPFASEHPQDPQTVFVPLNNSEPAPKTDTEEDLLTFNDPKPTFETDYDEDYNNSPYNELRRILPERDLLIKKTKRLKEEIASCELNIQMDKRAGKLIEDERIKKLDSLKIHYNYDTDILRQCREQYNALKRNDLRSFVYRANKEIYRDPLIKAWNNVNRAIKVAKLLKDQIDSLKETIEADEKLGKSIDNDRIMELQAFQNDYNEAIDVLILCKREYKNGKNSFHKPNEVAYNDRLSRVWNFYDEGVKHAAPIPYDYVGYGVALADARREVREIYGEIQGPSSEESAKIKLNTGIFDSEVVIYLQSLRLEQKRKLNFSTWNPLSILKILEHGEELPVTVIETIPFHRFTKSQITNFLYQNIIHGSRCFNKNISDMSHEHFRKLLVSMGVNEKTNLIEELFFSFLTDDKKKLIMEYFKGLCDKNKIYTPAFQEHLKLFMTNVHLMTTDQFRVLIQKVNFSLTNYLSYLSITQISYAIMVGKELQLDDPSIIQKVISKERDIASIPMNIAQRINLSVIDELTIVALFELLSMTQKISLNLSNWTFPAIRKLYQKCDELPKATATIDLTRWTADEISIFIKLSGTIKNFQHINGTTVATNIEKISGEHLTLFKISQIEMIDFRRLNFDQLLKIVNNFNIITLEERLKKQLGRVDLAFFEHYQISALLKCIPFFTNIAPHLNKIPMEAYITISIEECRYIDFSSLTSQQKSYFSSDQKRVMINGMTEREEYKSSNPQLDFFAERHLGWNSFKSNLESTLKIIRQNPISPKPDNLVYNQLRHLILIKGSELRLSDLFKSLESEKVKKRYKEISLLTHPDKNRGEEESPAIFKLFSAAYEIIKDYLHI